MPSSADRGRDPLKDYWWVLLVAVLFVGGWLGLSSPAGTGSEDVRIASAGGESAAEQSLRSLDSAENPSGAPGNALSMPGASASASASDGSTQAGSLYQAPGAAAGSPIPEGAGEAIEAAAKAQRAGGGTSLADALRGVSAAKAPDNGWGGAQARSGFARPKAEFGKVGESRSGGSGSTSASLVVVEKAFGTGGKTGLDLGPGLSGGPDAKGRIAAGMQGGPGLDGLKAAQKASLDALRQGDEAAAGSARRSFDGGSSGRSALQQLKSNAASAGAAGIGDDGGVPTNLKAGDPAKMTQKEFEPPPLEKTEEKKDENNKQWMQQQMMMMIMSVAISGIMGPMAGAIGTSLVGAMGMNPPTSGAMDKVSASGG